MYLGFVGTLLWVVVCCSGCLLSVCFGLWVCVAGVTARFVLFGLLLDSCFGIWCWVALVFGVETSWLCCLVIVCVLFGWLLVFILDLCSCYCLRWFWVVGSC